MQRRKRLLASGARGMHRIWERARKQTHTLAALGRGAPRGPAWPRWSAVRGCGAGQPGRWDSSRLLAAHASKEAGRSPWEATGLMPRRQTCKGGGPCSGHSWDPRSSHTPALQSLSPASARGCCASGARQRGSPPAMLRTEPRHCDHLLRCE